MSDAARTGEAASTDVVGVTYPATEESRFHPNDYKNESRHFPLVQARWGCYGSVDTKGAGGIGEQAAEGVVAGAPPPPPAVFVASRR